MITDRFAHHQLPIEKQLRLIKKRSKPKLFGVRIYYYSGHYDDCNLVIWLLWMPIYIFPFTSNGFTQDSVKTHWVDMSVYGKHGCEPYYHYE